MGFDFSCPDWWEKLQQGETPIPELPLNEEAAEVAVEWFDRLRLPDVPGQPELREAAGEWMRDIVRAIFGSMETSTQGYASRRIGEVFVLVPKKNAKTTSAAAIALTFMMMNRRRHADMLIIGPTQKIAEVAFEQAKGMIEADPDYLGKRLHVRDHKKTIEDRLTRSRLMVRTFGMDVLTGAKPVFCLIDEIHILGSIPYAADVIRQIRGGMMPFPEALLVMITTQSDHPPQGVFRSELQYARGVRDGVISEGVRLLPVLYEFPEEIQTSRERKWRDPDLWHLVTPNMNRSITLDRLRDGLRRAEHDGQHEVIAWATQHLNVEVGLALHSNRWRGADFWEAATDRSLTFEALLERSEVIVAGIDVGGGDDLTALALLGREAGSRRWLHWVHAWAYPTVLEERKEVSHVLEGFAAQGQLTFVEDTTQEIELVSDRLAKVHAAGLFPEAHGVGCDSWGVSSFVDRFVEIGLPEELITNVKQGAFLADAIYDLERRLRDRRFAHAGLEMMAWSIGNAVTRPRGNRVLIEKETAGKCKIDPLVATFNAVMVMQLNPDAAGAASISIPEGYEVA